MEKGDRFAASREYFKAYVRIKTSVLVGLVLTVLIFISLSCDTYSINWVTVGNWSEDGAEVIIVGLWQTCANDHGKNGAWRICLRFSEVPVFVNVCRALMIIACITCLVAFVCIVVGLKKDSMLLRLAGVFLCLSGLFAAAAVIIFPIAFPTYWKKNFEDLVSDPEKRHMRVGYGIISTSVTAILCWVTALLVAIPSKKPRHHTVKMLSPESQSLLYQKY